MNWAEKDGVRWLQTDLVLHHRAQFRCAFPTHEVGKAHRKPPEGDGHVPWGAGTVGLVHTADCLPVALAGPCCYEVGPEVLDAFAGLGDGIATGRMLDLPEVARRLLREAGVEEIESSGLCTSCEAELFFSHRRDGGPGRQAGLVWLDGEAA